MQLQKEKDPIDTASRLAFLVGRNESAIESLDRLASRYSLFSFYNYFLLIITLFSPDLEDNGVVRNIVYTAR